MLASYFVVVITIVNSTLAQYSEGVKKKLGLGAPPLLLKVHQLGDSSAEMGGKGIKVLVCPISTWLYACIWRATQI